MSEAKVRGEIKALGGRLMRGWWGRETSREKCVEVKRIRILKQRCWEFKLPMAFIVGVLRLIMVKKHKLIKKTCGQDAAIWIIITLTEEMLWLRLFGLTIT